MASGITPFPKDAQTRRRRGKPETAAQAAASAEADVAVRKIRGGKKAAIEVVGEPVPSFGGSATELDVSKIVEIRNPRILTSAAEQKSLTESVREHGVLQPIRVRPLADGTFAVTAGHRRFLAAKTNKLPTIPAVVAIASESTAFVESLVENLQREDLNPIDEARALQVLIAETGKTQTEIGKDIGRSQSYVANSLRMLELAAPVKQAIEDGRLTVSHGKALASLPPERQIAVAIQAVEKKLPSREIEDRIRREKEEEKRSADNRARQSAASVTALERIEAFLVENPTLDRKAITVITRGYGDGHLVESFKAAGFNARPNQHGDHTKPEWSCDEAAVNLSYQEWTGAFDPTCTEPDHRAEYVKERDKDKKAAAKLVDTKLDKARGIVDRGIRLDSGKGLLNLDGQRLALYVLLISPRPGEYNTSDRADSLVKRHGGEREGVRIAAIDVIETIQGLSEKDLGAELARLLTGGWFVNVWGEGPRPENGYAVREWLVQTFGLEEDLVWGDSAPSHQVLKSWVERGRTLTEAQQASYDATVADQKGWAIGGSWDVPRPNSGRPHVRRPVRRRRAEDQRQHDYGQPIRGRGPGRRCRPDVRGRVD